MFSFGAGLAFSFVHGRSTKRLPQDPDQARTLFAGKISKLLQAIGASFRDGGFIRHETLHEPSLARFGLFAIFCDVAPACAGGFLQIVAGRLQVIRGFVHNEQALGAQLVFMGFDAKHFAALARGHRAAEILDLIATAALQLRSVRCELGLQRGRDVGL